VGVRLSSLSDTSRTEGAGGVVVVVVVVVGRGGGFNRTVESRFLLILVINQCKVQNLVL